MRIVIKNGRLINPENQLDSQTDLWISNGRIVAIGDGPVGFNPDKEINAEGLIVCPGLVDIRARLREPGYEQKANIASETRAAVASGITTLCCPPDTYPVVDTPAVIELIHQRAEDAGYAHIEVIGALTQQLEGKQLSAMGALKVAGCRGVSNACHGIKDTQTFLNALAYAKSFNLTVFLQPMDPWLAEGCMHEGAISTRHGIAGIPETAETISVARDLLLVEQKGAKAHFCHISAARTLELLEQANGRGLNITADISINNLHLTEMDVTDYNSECHVYPPLRSLSDRNGLRNALKTGQVKIITSDHQPHEADAKQAPFAQTEAGISGLDTLLPLTLRLVEEGVFSLNEAIAALTCHPAKVLGIQAGNLSVDQTADICIFDPDQTWTVNPDDFISSGKNTPYTGWELKGRVTHTLSKGKVVFERN